MDMEFAKTDGIKLLRILYVKIAIFNLYNNASLIVYAEVSTGHIKW